LEKVMRNGQLDNVLRHIRSTAAARQVRELPDRELLERFVADHDEVAFTALVERHGGLVLGVCRRILRNEHDAEDACQATFLVLTRKAGTIRKGDSLASWLYGVAGRIARKLQAEAQRRSSDDVLAAEVAGPDTTGEITWREGLAVLDEELRRLPGSYRSALVLCYLEGRRQDEAARELGCSLGVLCGRLVRARECLRKRMVRRGVALPAALVGTALVSTYAGAALPPALAVRTVIAAAALLSGQALAHLVPTRIATLTEGVLTTMFVSRVKILVALLLLSATLLVAGTGALRATAQGEKHLLPANEVVPAAVTLAADAKESDRAAENKRSPGEPTVPCVVRDRAGKPIAGARVYLTSVTTVAAVTSIKALPRAQWGYIKKVVAEGKTDAEGRCELRGRLTGLEVPDSMSLAAVAPGYGLSGKTRIDLPAKGAANQAPIAITLRPEVKIKGQLLTPAGAPAQGVRVRLNSIAFDGGDGVAVDISDSWKIKDSDLPYWPTAVVTNAQGRFTLDGFSEDADASLTLTHDDFELQDILVSTKAKGSDGARRLKPEFKHALAPGRTLRGVVTAADTGKPLPGVFLDIQADAPNGLFFGEARTDEQGRYQMPGPAGLSNYQVGAYPPPDSGYLALRGGRGGKWPAGAQLIEVSFVLPRGRLIRGTVFDGDTKKPLAGVSIVYEPHKDNQRFWNKPYDLVSPVLTDKEGRFTITGLTGKGFLLAEGPSVEYVRTMLPWREGLLRGDRYLHGYAKVNVPETEEPAAAELTLRKGVTLEARVLRPDGSPVSRVMAYSRGMDPLSMHAYRWDYGVPVEKGLFRMSGCDADRAYRVFFIQPELHLGAVVELRAGAKPAEVRLEPTASVRGRLVHSDGSSAKAGWAAARLATTKDDGKLDPKSPGLEAFDWADRTMGFDMLIQGFAGPPKPNDGDRFLVEDLIPSAQLYIEASAGGLVVRRPVILKPGEVKDLGTLKLLKPGEKP
jgi:RNA polymerase sigma factor (sigma-70 family)